MTESTRTARRTGTAPGAAAVPIRVARDADFLALVPSLVGMPVERSLVLVVFRGTRSGEAMRVDLPAGRSRRELRGLADACVALAARCRGADGVAIVVFTDAGFEAERGLPWHDLAREVAARMDRAGFDVVSQLCVAADGWGRYDARGDRGPWPLAEIADSPVAASLPPLEPPIEGGARLPEPDPGLEEGIAGLVAGLMAGLERAATTPRSSPGRGPSADAEELYETVEAMLGDGGMPGGEGMPGGGMRDSARALALLVAAANVPLWRDVLMLWIAFELAVEHHDLGDLFAGQARIRPSVPRCRRGIDGLLRAAANAAEPLRAGPLCMAAWLSWALGRSSTAGALLAEAARLDPEHRLTALLDTFIGAGRVPDWAFAQEEDDVRLDRAS